MSHQTDQYEPHVASSETNQVERLILTTLTRAFKVK